MVSYLKAGGCLLYRYDVNNNTIKGMTMKTISYELWFYDVWGNAEDGYNVNDRNCADENVEFDCENNEYPTMAQIAEYLGCSVEAIEDDNFGDETHLYISESVDGKPLCEFIRNDPE